MRCRAFRGNWTARLLANQKERLLISAIGSEFVCKKHLSS